MEAALDQAGSLDIPSLLSDVPLTSLNTTLSNFIQNISNGDVTSEEEVIRFVAELQDSFIEVLNKCGIDEGLLNATAFEALLEELITGLGSGEDVGCLAAQEYLLNEIVLRSDRLNFNDIND